METILYFQPPSKTSAPGKFAGVQENSDVANKILQILGAKK